MFHKTLVSGSNMALHPVSGFGMFIIAIATPIMTGQAGAAVSYKYTDLGLGTAYDINNNGEVVGADGANAVVWKGTNKTILGLGAAYGINNLGQVVGDIRDNAVLWNGTAATALPDFDKESGVRSVSANDLNDVGQIIGSSVSDCCPSLDVYWKNYTTTPELLGDKFGRATAINNKGQIVVNAYLSTYVQNGTTHDYFDDWPYVTGINDVGHTVGGWDQALLWYTPHGAPIVLKNLTGFSLSTANAINNKDEVAGRSFNTFADDAPTGHATIWNHTSAIDLNTFLPADVLEAGWVLTNAETINDSGWIIGEAYNSSLGAQHAFVLTPIPEPETYALFLVGLVLIGVLGRGTAVC